MKKFFWLIVFLVPINCFGISYTEYGDYQYSFSEVKESELVEVTREKLYKFYTENKVYGGYFKEGKNKTDYPIKSDDIIMSPFSDYQEELVNEEKNRIIEEKEFTYYQKLRGIRYITFKYFNVTGAYTSSFFISDIKVYYGDALIEYTYTDDKNIYRNSINNKFGKYSISKSYIIIDLGEEYDLDELEIEISFNSDDYICLTYDLYLDYEYNPFTKYIINRVGHDFVGYYNQKITVDENTRINKTYVNTKTIKNNFSYISYTKTLYRYQDMLFRYYKIVRIYLEDYYLEKDGYIKDSKKFIYRYKYRVRNIVAEENDGEEKEKSKEIVETKIEAKPQNANSRQILFDMIPIALIGLVYFLYKLFTDKGD